MIESNIRTELNLYVTYFSIALFSGGAPLAPDTHSLARTCLCVPLMQGYGLTETTACATVTA